MLLEQEMENSTVTTEDGAVISTHTEGDIQIINYMWPSGHEMVVRKNMAEKGISVKVISDQPVGFAGDCCDISRDGNVVTATCTGGTMRMMCEAGEFIFESEAE